MDVSAVAVVMRSAIVGCIVHCDNEEGDCDEFLLEANMRITQRESVYVGLFAGVEVALVGEFGHVPSSRWFAAARWRADVWRVGGWICNEPLPNHLRDVPPGRPLGRTPG